MGSSITNAYIYYTFLPTWIFELYYYKHIRNMMEYVAYYLDTPQKAEMPGPQSTNSLNPMFNLFAESGCINSNYLKTLQLKKEIPRYNLCLNSNPYIMQHKMKYGSLHCSFFCILIQKTHQRIHALNSDIFQKELFCFYSCSEYKMNTSNAPFIQRPLCPLSPFNSSSLEQATLCNSVIQLQQ